MIKKGFVDLHCHPFKEYFDNREEVILDAYNNGVSSLFLVGTDLNNCQEALDLAKQFNFTFPIIGIHPNDSWNEEVILDFEKLVDETVVGIGEVGLDYHYEDAPSKKMQKQAFKMQMEIAQKNQIPVIVHSRDAHEDTFEMIKDFKSKYPEQNFVLHSYSSGVDYVEKYVELGVYFSFSGIVTFKNAKDMQEALKMVPSDLLFFETDTPYLAPVPHRGKTNLPLYVIDIYKFAAEIKNVDVNVLVNQVNKNVETVFPKIKNKNII